jgi:hypothetical protein
MANPNKAADLAWLFVSLRLIIKLRIMLSISVAPRRMTGCTQFSASIFSDVIEHAADANTNIIGDTSKITSCKEMSKEEFSLGFWAKYATEYAIAVDITKEADITVGTLQAADLIAFLLILDRSCVDRIRGVSEELPVG